MESSLRRKQLAQFNELDHTREERALLKHNKADEIRETVKRRLATTVGRDPTNFKDDGAEVFRRANEERYLISQVVSALQHKGKGVWSPSPQIGDLYAQREKSNIGNFEMIRDASLSTGGPPSSFFDSKYYKKRMKELRSHIEKIRPKVPEVDGLIFVGKPLQLVQPEEVHFEETEPEIIADDTKEKEEVHSSVKLSISSNRLFFRTTAGVTLSKSVTITNDGTTAVYYKWELAKDLDLMLGEGNDRTTIRKPTLSAMPEIPEEFDWRLSDSFSQPANMQPTPRSEFLFTQEEGSILPGRSIVFSFAFKSDIPGCFTQRWIMRVTPKAESEKPLVVALRGCCEQEPPALADFKASIDQSLRDSEEARCVDEIMSTILERVELVIAEHGEPKDQRIEGEVLVDDRAPIFEAANSQWSVKYSPALYEACIQIANRCWDALGVYGFDRYWDNKITTLAEMALKITNGQLKREILGQINGLFKQSTTESTSSNLNYSLAFVQFSSMFEELPTLFSNAAKSLGQELPQFEAPKMPDPSEDEEGADSPRKRGRQKQNRRSTSRKPRRGKGEEDPKQAGNAVQPGQPMELSPELRSAMKEIVVAELRRRLPIFERLAMENRKVTTQLTRVDEMERLDTNLEAEVEDEL